MSINATHIIRAEDISTFLESGAILSVDSSRVVVAWNLLDSYTSPQRGVKNQFYHPDFFLEKEKPWFVYQNSCVVANRHLAELLAAHCESVKTQLEWQEPNLQSFTESFTSIQNLIRQNEISKAVPVVFASSNKILSLEERALVLQKLLFDQTGIQIYGLWHVDRSSECGSQSAEVGILGATPELLFSVRDSVLQTMALAGTKSVKAEQESSLLNDQKEMSEHGFVVEDVQERLKSLGTVETGKTYVWNIGPICHLRTDIRVDLKEKNVAEEQLESLVHLLHPTAALGVFPRQMSWKKLQEWQSVENRGALGAPFGVLNCDGLTKIVVAIRNVQWFEGKTWLGAGCGVVKQSILENEWNELKLKRHATVARLGL